MVAFGRRSTSDYPRYDSFDSDEIFAFDEMTPGERVCPPPHRSRMAAALRSILFLLIAVGVGWVLMADRTAWPEWLNVVLDHSTGLIDRAQTQLNDNATRVAEGPEPSFNQPSLEQAALDERALPETEGSSPSTEIAAESPEQMERPEEVESREVVTLNATETQDDESSEVLADNETASLPETAADNENAQPERLPPPRVDPEDPYQRRAVAVGLHPGLSRVLLERMSPTDYRNAGIAIQRALGNPDNNATVVWPRQRIPELALFRVRFVPGAPQGCRRYVVTITKDGWTTTAPPMESCGSRTASLPHR